MTNKENENYGNGTFNEKISQAKSLNILSQIREKYNKQIDNIQVDHRFKSTNIVENNLVLNIIFTFILYFNDVTVLRRVRHFLVFLFFSRI